MAKKMSKSEAGRLGGISTFRKYGKDHMSKIGAVGGFVMHEKYDLVPYQRSDFAIIDRITGKVVALLSGRDINKIRKDRE